MLQNVTSKLAPRIVAILIALAGVGLLAWQARHLYLQMSRLPAVADRQPTAPSALSPALLSRLFGQALAAPVASLQGVVLQGCAVADDPLRSHALIHVEGQGTLMVFPGDEFLPGLSIQEIGTDHVLFNRNGTAGGRLDFPSIEADARLKDAG